MDLEGECMPSPPECFLLQPFRSPCLSLSSPLTKMTNTFLCAWMQFPLFAISCKKPSPRDNKQTRRGFLVLANSNLWMDSNGKLRRNNNIINPPQIILWKYFVFYVLFTFLARRVVSVETNMPLKAYHLTPYTHIKMKDMWLRMNNKSSMIKVVKRVSICLIFSFFFLKTNVKRL